MNPFDTPYLGVLAVLTWIPLTVWIISLIHWMIEDEVDVLTGLLGIVIGFALGFLVFRPPNALVPPLIFGGVFITVLAFAPMRNLIRKRQLHTMDIEGMERAYEQIAMRPDNVGAKLRLAKLLYSRGLHAQAVALGETVLKNMPQQAFEDEFKTVGEWRRLLGKNVIARSIPCLDCGTPNESGVVVCKNCGSRFLIDHAKGRFIGTNLARRLMFGWLATMSLLIGAPLSAVTLQFPLAGVGIALCVAVSCLFGALALRPGTN